MTRARRAIRVVSFSAMTEPDAWGERLCVVQTSPSGYSCEFCGVGGCAMLFADNSDTEYGHVNACKACVLDAFARAEADT